MIGPPRLSDHLGYRTTFLGPQLEITRVKDLVRWTTSGNGPLFFGPVSGPINEVSLYVRFGGLVLWQVTFAQLLALLK